MNNFKSSLPIFIILSVALVSFFAIFNLKSSAVVIKLDPQTEQLYSLAEYSSALYEKLIHVAPEQCTKTCENDKTIHSRFNSCGFYYCQAVSEHFTFQVGYKHQDIFGNSSSGKLSNDLHMVKIFLPTPPGKNSLGQKKGVYWLNGFDDKLFTTLVIKELNEINSKWNNVIDAYNRKLLDDKQNILTAAERETYQNKESLKKAAEEARRNIQVIK